MLHWRQFCLAKWPMKGTSFNLLMNAYYSCPNVIWYGYFGPNNGLLKTQKLSDKKEAISEHFGFFGGTHWLISCYLIQGHWANMDSKVRRAIWQTSTFKVLMIKNRPDLCCIVFQGAGICLLIVLLKMRVFHCQGSVFGLEMVSLSFVLEKCCLPTELW